MNLSQKTVAGIQKIGRDRKHGASQIARMAARIFLEDAKSCRQKSVEAYLLRRKEIGRRLIEAKPSMSSIYNIVSDLLSVTGKADGQSTCEEVKSLTAERAQSIIDLSLKAQELIAEAGLELIEDGYRLFAYSYSSTMNTFIKVAHQKRNGISVIVPVSGPGSSGKVTARELAEDDIEVILIADAAIGQYIESANLAICGADRVTFNGNTINANGTSLVAMAAKFVEIPFVIACERLKFDPRKDYEPDLEPGSEDEITGRQKFPPFVSVRNFTFDVTPSVLIDKYVTETGIMIPEEVRSCMINQRISNQEEKPG